MTFRGELQDIEIDQLEKDTKGTLKGVWLYKATHCPTAQQGPHSYIPIAWKLTNSMKQVSVLLCTQCFHEINIAEAFEHRTKL